MNRLKNIFKIQRHTDGEIINNPMVLFNRNFSADEMTLSNHKIGDDVLTLNIEDVNMTGQEVYPGKTKSRIYKEGKAFVVIDNEEIEFTLEERIKAVIEFGGWLGYIDGSRFRISNHKIDSFSLHLERLSPYKSLTKSYLIRGLGKDSKIEETYEDYDGTLFNTDVFNFERRISIQWNEWDKKISVICIGELVSEKRVH